jgi:hypothetical protein
VRSSWVVPPPPPPGTPSSSNLTSLKASDGRGFSLVHTHIMIRFLKFLPDVGAEWRRPDLAASSLTRGNSHFCPSTNVIYPTLLRLRSRSGFQKLQVLIIISSFGFRLRLVSSKVLYPEINNRKQKIETNSSNTGTSEQDHKIGCP